MTTPQSAHLGALVKLSPHPRRYFTRIEILDGLFFTVYTEHDACRLYSWYGS